MTSIHTYPSTPIPCPPWCGYPAGHGFHSTDAAAGLDLRDHVKSISDDISTTRGIGAVSVVIEQLETASQDVLVDRTTPRVAVEGYCEGDPLTAPEARQLAAALLNAADELDRIAASS